MCHINCIRISERMGMIEQSHPTVGAQLLAQGGAHWTLAFEA